MSPLVDTSRFPTGAPTITYDDPEELAQFEEMRTEAARYVASFPVAQPIETLTLAFGLAPIIALFLVRFTTPIARGEQTGEIELWVVVGDLPFMCFETENITTPAIALQAYCAIAQDWADQVMAGGDISEFYPIAVESTREHAEMLLSRIEFIREQFVPLA